MSRAEVLMLADGLTIADVVRAFRRSGLAVSNGAFPNLFVIGKAVPRFSADNVIDLAAEIPALLRPQI